MRFGRLTVVSRAPDHIAERSGYKTVMWNCVCDCGNKTVTRGKCLTRGVTTSCGCYAREMMSKRASKHHGFGTRLYAVWNSMRQRCNNPNNKAYKNYGGRGISICSEWDDFAVFEQWARDTGYDDDAPKGVCTLDRIDVNGNYCPSNCRWTTMREQTRNRRDTPYYTLDGETHDLKTWAELTGIKYETLWARHKRGWDADRALR